MVRASRQAEVRLSLARRTFFSSSEREYSRRNFVVYVGETKATRTMRGNLRTKRKNVHEDGSTVDQPLALATDCGP